LTTCQPHTSVKPKTPPASRWGQETFNKTPSKYAQAPIKNSFWSFTRFSFCSI